MAGRLRWRHLTIQAMMMSLVFQAIVAAFMLPMPLRMAGGAEAPTSGLAICTGASLIRADSSDTGGRGETPPAGTPCPICDGILTSAFPPESTQSAVYSPLNKPVVLRPSDEACPASATRFANHSRAPPAQA